MWVFARRMEPEPYLLDLAQQVGVHAVALLRAHRAEVVLHPDLGHELVQPALRHAERKRKKKSFKSKTVKNDFAQQARRAAARLASEKPKARREFNATSRSVAPL